ncbi:MAG: nitrous oxide reductase accessory protein NosL [Deltaproteobacteria bacterium]
MQTSRKRWQILVPVLLFLLLQLPQTVRAQSSDQVTEKSRCAVCGMFVAKHPNWISRIEQEGQPTLFFDGVKDLMVYYFNPEKYGGQKVSADAKILVKDYYTLDWIDGRKAYFVGGSDVYGPMGNELIPFSVDAANAVASRTASGLPSY